MRKVFFASVLVLLVMFWFGCGEENPTEIGWTSYVNSGGSSGTGSSAISTSDEINVQVQEYFPLRLGNKWHYEERVNGDIISDHCSMVIQTVNIEGENYFQVGTALEGDLGEGFDYYVYSGNTILNKPAKSLETYVYLDTNMIVGVDKISVPAGEFRCIKIKRQSGVIEWYAQDIGLVKKDYGITSITANSPQPITGHLVTVLTAYDLK